MSDELVLVPREPPGTILNAAADYFGKFNVRLPNGFYWRDLWAAMLAAAPAASPTSEGAPWIVWSNEHRAFWAPNRRGYTQVIERAGRYSYEEAETICRGANYRSNSTINTGTPPEICMPAPEALAALSRPQPVRLDREAFRAALRTAYRRAGGIPRLARAPGGTSKIVEIAVLEADAILALPGEVGK